MVFVPMGSTRYKHPYIDNLSYVLHIISDIFVAYLSEQFLLQLGGNFLFHFTSLNIRTQDRLLTHFIFLPYRMQKRSAGFDSFVLTVNVF